jgi:hypothetical protein
VIVSNAQIADKLFAGPQLILQVDRPLGPVPAVVLVDPVVGIRIPAATERLERSVAKVILTTPLEFGAERNTPEA